MPTGREAKVAEQKQNMPEESRFSREIVLWEDGCAIKGFVDGNEINYDENPHHEVLF